MRLVSLFSKNEFISFDDWVLFLSVCLTFLMSSIKVCTFCFYVFYTNNTIRKFFTQDSLCSSYRLIYCLGSLVSFLIRVGSTRHCFKRYASLSSVIFWTGTHNVQKNVWFITMESIHQQGALKDGRFLFFIIIYQFF